MALTAFELNKTGSIGRLLLATSLAITASAFMGCSSPKAPVQARFDKEFDDVAKPWQEIAVQMPALPVDANLLPFDVSATATQRFAIDPKSLSIGSDGVVRYTLVSFSAAGARNVSYEGIRCASREQKIYALGHPDGTWSRARRDQWQPIINDAINRQQAALAQDYFCDGNSIAGSVRDILARLQRRKTLSSDLLRS